ncbi:MAG: hypothetical protein AABZ30_02790, partial [Myxococcota bacterium]
MRRVWVWVLAGACAEPTELMPRGESCLLSQCHGRVEEAHYGGAALACVDCHGGNPADTTKEGAHPTVTISFNPSSPGGHEPGGLILADPALADLDDLDRSVLKFLNPADYRVVRETCGSTTLGAGNCHTRIADSSVLSTHATLLGQLAGGLFFGGLGPETADARFGVRAVADPYASSEFLGTTPSIERFPAEMGPMATSGDIAQAFFPVYSQLCLECHLGRDGTPTPGKYYSSGCNACHLMTANDARPVTADPTQEVEELGHPQKHRLTNLIPDSQCNHCHHAHLHRGLLIQGVRERSEEGDADFYADLFGDAAQVEARAHRGREESGDVVFWPEENYVRHQGGYWLYGKPYPFFVADEDGTNEVDETPPDIHFEKGMACIDCHTMRELHGGEHMPLRRDFEAQVRCESCHGGPGAPIDVGAAPFEQALSRVGGTGDNLRVLGPGKDGELGQIGKLDGGRLHPVTQIARRLDAKEPRHNPRTLMGCGLHAAGGTDQFRLALKEWIDSTPPAERDELFPGLPEGLNVADVGWAHRPGRLECFACHNTWTPNCYGCHIVRDDRECGRTLLDGSCQPKIKTFAMSVLAEARALGMNARSRISPTVGTSIFFSHVDASGKLVIDAQPLTTPLGVSGDGNSHNPVHHHTVAATPRKDGTNRALVRDCEGCHPRADGKTDWATLKRAIGFGTGEYTFR